MTDIVTLLLDTATIEDIKRGGVRLLATSRRPVSSPGPMKFHYQISAENFRFGNLTLDQSHLFTIGGDFMFHLFFEKSQTPNPFNYLKDLFGLPAVSDTTNQYYQWNNINGLTMKAFTGDNDLLKVQIFTPPILSQTWAGIN